MPGVKGQVPAPPLPFTAWGLHFAEPRFPLCPTTLQGCWGGNTWWWPEEVCSVSQGGPGLPPAGPQFPLRGAGRGLPQD